MFLRDAPSKLLNSIARRLRNHQWEHSPNGILLPRDNLTIGGVFEHDVNGRDLRYDHNLVVTEGLNHTLATEIGNGAAVTTWYVVPFKGNYTPVAGLTAATFPAAATEATEYDEATRVQYVDGTPSGGSIDNLASKAAFTINAGITIYGVALVSVSTKSSTSGTLFSATRFGSSRPVVATDVLNVGYTVTLTSS